MHPIIYYVSIYLTLGAIGMALGNRSVPKKVKTTRWLKFVSYTLIVSFIIFSMIQNFFPIVALIIVGLACLEWYQINTPWFRNRFFFLSSSILVLILSSFIVFSWQTSSNQLLYIYFLIFTLDGFSQVVGQLLGRNLLCPQLSPNKTWEGLIGGVFFAMLSGFLAKRWIKFDWDEALFFSLWICLWGIAGDLLASYYKRLRNIKDYSHILPGQGGILDRFDSFILAGVASIILDYCVRFLTSKPILYYL